MFRLIGGDIYRLLRKKSLFIYIGALAAGYFALAFIRSGGFTEESLVNDALSLFIVLPALVGGYLFAAVYTDDLSSKNLVSLVGFGLNKAAVIIAKFMVTVLFSAVIFGLMPLYHTAIYTVLGQKATGNMAAIIYAASLKHLLTAIAFSALSGIVVYGLQRATFAIVAYLLLAFGVVGSLVSIALNTFAPTLTEHLMSGITDRILLCMMSGKSLTGPVIEYIVYVLLALALSIVAFYRKEMEF